MNGLLWPLLLYIISVLVVVSVMVGLSYVLGQRHSAPARNEVFESGIAATGSARVRFSAQFYIVALLFLVFDLEAVFLYAWAIALRQVGWAGYAGAMIFLAVLAIVLIYEWRMGALDWFARKIARSRGGSR